MLAIREDEVEDLKENPLKEGDSLDVLLLELVGREILELGVGFLACFHVDHVESSLGVSVILGDSGIKIGGVLPCEEEIGPLDGVHHLLRSHVLVYYDWPVSGTVFNGQIPEVGFDAELDVDLPPDGGEVDEGSRLGLCAKGARGEEGLEVGEESRPVLHDLKEVGKLHDLLEVPTPLLDQKNDGGDELHQPFPRT